MSNPTTSHTPLVSVRDLRKYFPRRRGLFGKRADHRAVDGVSFEIARGKTLAIVGEYVWSALAEARRRPQFVIEAATFDDVLAVK